MFLKLPLTSVLNERFFFYIYIAKVKEKQKKQKWQSFVREQWEWLLGKWQQIWDLDIYNIILEDMSSFNKSSLVKLSTTAVNWTS